MRGQLLKPVGFGFVAVGTHQPMMLLNPNSSHTQGSKVPHLWGI